MRHAQEPTNLAKAFAALFATLIAAIAHLAAEQPLLAPSLRMSIRQIEKLAKQIDAMATEWQATRHRPAHKRRTGFSPPNPRTPQIPPKQTGEPVPSLRGPGATWNPATAPRAPPNPTPARNTPRARPHSPGTPSGREPHPLGLTAPPTGATVPA